MMSGLKRSYAAAGTIVAHRKIWAAHRQQDQTPEEIEQMALELRQAHMRFSILLSYWQH
jgi:hypothetical protein